MNIIGDCCDLLYYCTRLTHTPMASFQYQTSFVLKALTTSIALAHFLLHDDLVTLEEVAATIGSECHFVLSSVRGLYS